jgi:predicted secreted protein
MIALGRQLLLRMENPMTPGDLHIVAMCRTNGWSVSNGQFNCTPGQGSRWRKLLKGGVQSISTNAEGVNSDAVTMGWLSDLWLSGKQAIFRLEDGMGNLVQGYFRLPSLTTTGAHNGAQTFSFSMQSSGRPYIYNVQSGRAGAALGHGGVSGLPGGFPGPSAMVSLPPPGPPRPSYPGDLYTQVSPYVGSTSGDADTMGTLYKMLGVFNNVTLGATPVFTSSDIIAAMVAPDGTAQSFGGPLTQVGLYYVYGYYNFPVVTITGSVNESHTYNIQFNAQNQTFTVIRPGFKFTDGSTIPIYDLATGPSGSHTLAGSPVSSTFDYMLVVDPTPIVYTHFGNDNLIWTPSFAGGTIAGDLSWNSFVSGDGVLYTLCPKGTITNLDPFPLPPAGGIFGVPLAVASYTGSYGLNAVGTGMRVLTEVQQTY